MSCPLCPPIPTGHCKKRAWARVMGVLEMESFHPHSRNMHPMLCCLCCPHNFLLGPTNNDPIQVPLDRQPCNSCSSHRGCKDHLLNSSSQTANHCIWMDQVLGLER